MIDERLERLINRKLDGELSEAESLELDKLLIRSPEGRAMLEEQGRLDRLAGVSLRAALGGDLAGRSVCRRSPLEWPSRSTRREHLWYGGIGLAAGFLLALLVSSLVMPLRSGNHEEALPPIADSGLNRDTGPVFADKGQNRELPPSLRDITGPWDDVPGQVFGVYDDNSRSLYLLEMSGAPARVTPAHIDY
ncbi:MAG: hypothetical protein KA354_16590 [Phycisphaerae bacterium]|nr:hypothetical protein [Phycisphaerae bacterium]